MLIFLGYQSRKYIVSPFCWWYVYYEACFLAPRQYVILVNGAIKILIIHIIFNYYSVHLIVTRRKIKKIREIHPSNFQKKKTILRSKAENAGEKTRGKCYYFHGLSRRLLQAIWKCFYFGRTGIRRVGQGSVTAGESRKDLPSMPRYISRRSASRSTHLGGHLGNYKIPRVKYRKIYLLLFIDSFLY